MFNNEGNVFTFSNKKQYLLFVSFSSASRSLGTSLTSLMLKDLMEVGTKSGYNPTLALYIDEFGSCENTLIVKDILEKGRSCNIATTLSMQDLNQLIINTNAPFMDSVLGTVNSFIIYSGATRETANKLAGTQIYEIEELLMSLKKPDPIRNTPPTAVYISKYPVFGKGGTEVYRFVPLSAPKNKPIETRVSGGVNNQATTYTPAIQPAEVSTTVNSAEQPSQPTPTQVQPTGHVAQPQMQPNQQVPATAEQSTEEPLTSATPLDVDDLL